MTNQSDITRQIDDRRAELEGKGLLVFEGERAQEVLQRLCYLEKVPTLSVYCEVGAGLPPVVYRNFVPEDYHAHVADQMFEVKGEVLGIPHSVYFHPSQNHGSTGDVVTFVAAVMEGFPEEELDSFPTPILDAEKALPPRAKR